MDCNRILARLRSRPLLGEDDGWARVHGENAPNEEERNLESGVQGQRPSEATETCPPDDGKQL